MNDVPIDERRFSDREVREILNRAVQDSPGRQVARRSGDSQRLTMTTYGRRETERVEAVLDDPGAFVETDPDAPE